MSASEKLAAYKKAKADVMASAKEIVKARLDEFWATAPPAIEAVRWQQFTPYFNDGEPCVFRVYESQFKLTAVTIDAEDQEDDDTYFLYDYQLHRYNEEIPKDVVGPDFSDIEELLLAAFDDHVQVTAARTGEITVDEYDHE